MDAIYFILRYIPWWAVPTFMMGVHFSIVFWSKDVRRLAYLSAAIAGGSAVSLAYYIWAGSPDRSVRYFDQFIQNL